MPYPTINVVRRLARHRLAGHFPSLSPVTWLTIEKTTQQVTWLLLFAILMPILGPRPYGLFAIAMVFVGFCEAVLFDCGAEALLSVDHLDQHHTSTANLCNGLLAIAATFALALSAPLIAYLFDDRELKWLLWALVPLPLLSSLMATPVAVLRLTMRFQRLAVRSIVGLMLGGVVGIGLALGGAGVWALILQVLVQRLCEFVILWLSVPARLRLGWSRPHFQEIWPVAQNVFASRISSFIGGQIPKLTVGYVLGPAQLGLFSLANRLLETIVVVAIQPRTVVGRVELRLSKLDLTAFGNTFRLMVMDVATVCVPLLIGTAILTPVLFTVWLDGRWADGRLPTQLVALSGIPTMLFFCATAGLMASQHSRLEAWVSLAQSISVSVTVFAAAPFGLEATALALLVRPILLLPLPLHFLRISSKLPASLVLCAVAGPLSGAVLMAGVIYAAQRLLVPQSWLGIPTLGALVVIGMMSYLLFLWLFVPQHVKGLFARMFTG
jgi:O-antigen/teichoic acid export membrane protein